MDLERIKIEAETAINQACSMADLDAASKKFLDASGMMGDFFKSMKSMEKSERSSLGVKANEVKKFLEALAALRKTELEGKAGVSDFGKEWIDITMPVDEPEVGHLHPLTHVLNRIEDIFHGLGFEVAESPEIENEWYHFDALNIPKDHPSRDVFDTFFIKEAGLLRAHTSPGQIRFMESHQPPLRIIVPGRVFRHDAVDASHEPNFHQVEGLIVDRSITVANFKAIIENFLLQFFTESDRDNCQDIVSGKSVRFRPTFFPFTEPSFEIDLACVHCSGKGCSACKGSGWMEIMGAGMVHPNVFKNAGLNPKFWQGFAFGIGVERLAMIKYRINDIRLFYEGERSFLEQF